MLKAIDFFCGAGGMTRGLLDAGVDVIAGIDNHLPSKETYEYEGNNTRPDGSASKFIHADIEKLTPEELIEQTALQKNDDNLIFAGCSPCQYWSKINTSRTKSAASKMLLKRFRHFVEQFEPGYIIVENVPGLLSRKDEAGLVDFLSFLDGANYTSDFNVISVSSYGIPQKRRRFLLIASRVSHPITLPEPDPTSDDPLEGIRVRDYIGTDHGFPSVPAGHRDETDFMHTAYNLSSKNLRRIRLTPKNGGDRSAWKDDPELQINAYKGKDDYFRDVYGRMSWDEPAPTITTRFVSLSNGRFGHPEEDRAISLREGATLQTFPKTYVFRGSLEEIARQIGNAVPPVLARCVGIAISNHWSISRPLHQ